MISLIQQKNIKNNFFNKFHLNSRKLVLVTAFPLHLSKLLVSQISHIRMFSWIILELILIWINVLGLIMKLRDITLIKLKSFIISYKMMVHLVSLLMKYLKIFYIVKRYKLIIKQIKEIKLFKELILDKADWHVMKLLLWQSIMKVMLIYFQEDKIKSLHNWILSKV
jgi:hypothetical protein